MTKRTMRILGLVVAVAALIAAATAVYYYHHRRSLSNQPSEAELILGGDHELRNLGEGTGTGALVVNFLWKMKDGIYAGSSLPLSKIRFNPDEKATFPTAKFRWSRCEKDCTVDSLMANNVRYMVITAKESDWPRKIKPPLN